MLRRIAAIEAAELPRRQQRDHQGAGAEGGNVAPSVSRVKAAFNAADEDIADHDIEKAPQHIDGRGGEALAGRLGKGL